MGNSRSQTRVSTSLAAGQQSSVLSAQVHKSGIWKDLKPQKPSIVIHAYNSSTLEADTERPEVQRGKNKVQGKPLLHGEFEAV